MDVVHFAETHGHDQDRVRPNAWRYRDYLIDAFNADTPYARFVQEQIAADVLFPDEPKLIPALGFLAAGPWDESSLRDIREDTIDREIARYLDRDDMVTTVFNTFPAADGAVRPLPRSQVRPDRAGRLLPTASGVRGRRPRRCAVRARSRRAQEAAGAARHARGHCEERCSAENGHAGIDESSRGVGTAEYRGRYRVERASVHENRVATSSTLTKQKDDSIRSEGTRPEKDTYTLTTRVKGKRITAVRLELLTDDMLPQRGPGRQDNGNLHLSEFTISAAKPAEDSHRDRRLRSSWLDRAARDRR